ncbi:uveal autoantigen with coiled-coil domains and ankyrin repeats [Ascaphus truei]|uniref:uveal autoantigen with coiled-coil domains and ankyrin repeats n=1 Tax=Ascaphus truei TaxID=8439 RepID=UPI003F59B432
MIRIAMENAPRGMASVRRAPSLQMKWSKQNSQEETHRKSMEQAQDLEAENEELRERLRKIQHEQRVLFEKVGGLQLQLGQEQMMSDDLENEKEELKSLLQAKEKELEESLRTMESLRGKVRYYEQKNHSAPSSPFAGAECKEEFLMKQSHVRSPDPQLAAHPPARSQLRPLELPGESEDQRQELERMRRFCEASREEAGRLQQELSRRSSECMVLASERDRSKAESDQQIQQLEEALRDVQKRMLDSEGKVKQMQTHFLALKDHLTQEALSGGSRAEDLQEQVREVKAKYEGASAEVGKLRNQLRHNELLVQELRREDSRLRKENRRLQEELAVWEEEKEGAERRAQEAEEHLALAVTTEKFENMRCLLTNEVNEKSRSLEEAAGGLARVLEELETAKRERKKADAKSEELRREVEEAKLRNRSLSREGEKLQTEKILLQRQIEELTGQMRSGHVPVQLHTETKRACEETIAQLSQSLAESEQRNREADQERETLQEDRKTLRDGMTLLQASSTPREEHEKELRGMQSRVVLLEKQLAEASRKCEEEAARAHSLLSENASLRDSHMPLTAHRQATATLTTELDQAKAQLARLKKQLESEAGEQAALRAQLEREAGERARLRAQLDKLKVQVGTEYMGRKEHEEKVSELQRGEEQIQRKCAENQAKYQRAQEEVQRLQAAIQEQRAELDTLQCCITERYAPLASMEEQERNFQAMRSALETELQEQRHSNRETQYKLEEQQRETQRLQEALESAERGLCKERVSLEQRALAEHTLRSQLEELRVRLQEAQEKQTDAEEKQRALQEESLRAAGQVQVLQERLRTECVPAEQHKELKATLSSTRASLEAELRGQVTLCKREQERVRKVEQELEEQRGCSIPSSQHAQEKEEWNRQAAAAQQKLREKEEAVRAAEQEVSQLREEVRKAQHRHGELQSSKERLSAEHRALQTELEERVVQLNKQLKETSSKSREDAARGVRELQAAREQSERLRGTGSSMEQEIAQLKGKYEQSLAALEELQGRSRVSARDIEEKDKEISALVCDVEKLSTALSQLTPGKSLSHSLETLQSQVTSLQCQLDEAQHRHQEIISIYRSHLLSAVQGHMDADVQDALLQIIHMRRELVC